MDDPLAPEVLVLPAFGADDLSHPDVAGDEVGRWLDAYDLDRSLAVAGANAPVRYGEGLAVTPTGMGKAAAASTVAALFGSPRLDLSATRVLTVGVAGAPPSVAPGSVVVADAVVDWDLKHRTDGGDPPVRPLDYRPRDYVWRPDPDLVAAAADAVDPASLATDEGVAARHRDHGTGDPAPRVVVGTSACGDEFWHGEQLAAQVDWLCGEYGVGDHVRTEMEDAATAAALERFDALDRWATVRAASNYDRPVDGGADGPSEAAFDLALENAFRAGRQVVGRLRDGG